MAKIVFKNHLQGQIALFPASLDEKIPANAPVRLINQIVDHLDISDIIETYKGGGTSSYHPRMMLKLVLYAYLNNVYSCRKIEKYNLENIHYMWLSGLQEPDHNTINNFRSSYLKDAINTIFTQVVLLLADMGYLSLDVVYTDGTKMESRANRYTFVWRKTVEKNRVKLEAKIHQVLEQIEAGIARDNQINEEPSLPINSEELKKRIAQINRENLSKENKKAFKTLEEKHLQKLQEYEKHLETLGTRNSYSKTDRDATFMRMKDDQMKNGQLKPAYNLQIGTENQFFTHVDFFPNPTDFLTFIPFNKDYFVCPMGQQMEKVGNSTRKSESGYVSNTTLYQAKNCTGFPLKCLCHNAKGNRQIEVNYQLKEYRRKARELLTSEEGLLHRSRRPIEPEAVFGQTKANKQYYRFRHFGLDKVKMDFAIFAVAFNLGKLCNKAKNTPKNQGKSSFFAIDTFIFVFVVVLTREVWAENEFSHKFCRSAA